MHLTISFTSPATRFLNLDTLRNALASDHYLSHFPKAVFLFRVSWALIGVYRGACMSFPSMLTCFRPLVRLAISISSSKGEFWVLGLN